MKKILFVASESVPFIKTGGLADVAGALPKCFDKRYFDVRVILPKYACMKQVWKDKMEYIKKEQFHINFGLEDNRKRGIGIGTFADLLQIFFSSCNGPVNDVLREDDHIVYDSDFDASYSWESVMTEIFDCIAPFLEDGSKLNVCSDDCYHLIVKNGITTYEQEKERAL